MIPLVVRTHAIPFTWVLPLFICWVMVRIVLHCHPIKETKPWRKEHWPSHFSGMTHEHQQKCIIKRFPWTSWKPAWISCLPFSLVRAITKMVYKRISTTTNPQPWNLLKEMFYCTNEPPIIYFGAKNELICYDWPKSVTRNP